MILRSQAEANAAAERQPGAHVHHTPDQIARAAAGQRSHEANIAAVALRLADALADVDADPDDAAGLPPAGWRLAVERARQLHPDWTPADGYQPGPATIAATVAVLRDRQAHPDPFDGFPA